MLRHLAKIQRVQTKQESMQTEQEIAINVQDNNKQRVTTAQVDMSPDLGIFKFEQPSDSNHMETCDAMHHPQFITQDDCDPPPSSNRRQCCKGTLTQDCMVHMMEQPGYKPPSCPNKPQDADIHSSPYAVLHMQFLTMRQVTSSSIAT